MNFGFDIIIVDVKPQIAEMDKVFFSGIGEAGQLNQVDLLVQDVFALELLQDDENGLIQGFVVEKEGERFS